MTACPHCRRWREAAEEAREALLRLDREEAALAARVSAVAGLTPAEGRFVAALYAAGDVAVYDRVEAQIGRNRPWMRVIRQKTQARAPWLRIEAVRAIGWRLAPAARAELRRRLEGGA